MSSMRGCVRPCRETGTRQTCGPRLAACVRRYRKHYRQAKAVNIQAEDLVLGAGRVGTTLRGPTGPPDKTLQETRPEC